MNDDRLSQLEEAFSRHIKGHAATSQWVGIFRVSGIAFMVCFGLAIASLKIKTEIYSFEVPLPEILQTLSAPAFASGIAAVILVLKGKKE